MPEQFDLFGGDPEKAKKDGMDRAEAHANPNWFSDMYGCVAAVCRTMELFTADDVFDYAEWKGVAWWATHDLRAFGPVMIHAARAKLCRKENVAAVMSRRPSLHKSPIQVWRSLIYGRSPPGASVNGDDKPLTPLTSLTPDFPKTRAWLEDLRQNPLPAKVDDRE